MESRRGGGARRANGRRNAGLGVRLSEIRALGARRVLRALLPLAALAITAPLTITAPLAAQSQLDLGGAMLPQGDEQRYLRALALTDSSGTMAVTLQPFGRRGDAAARARALTLSHPWRARFAAPAPAEARWRPQLRILRPVAGFRYQSDRPWPEDDGVVWAGVGTTMSVQAGMAAHWGPLRAQVAPVAFAAENRDFALAPNGFADERRFRDGRFPGAIDLPQRFGDAAYRRVDLGDSFIEVEAFGFVTGLSNARQHWGPSQFHPLVIGSGSGGFAHAHLSTASPLATPIGAFQFRLLAGRLEQSAYSPITSGETSRFLSGMAMSLRPRFVPSIEVGVTRIINGPWPPGGLGLADALRPFEGIINDNAQAINKNADNGFASVFARFAPKGGGLEAYGELSREDFAGDPRQLYLEPDDLMHLSVGIARSTRVGERMRVLRAELVNGEINHYEREGRSLVRPIPPYTHTPTSQGLTNRGQLLGSYGAYGGSAAVISWHQYSVAGSASLAAERLVRADWLPTLGVSGGIPQSDVSYRLRFERARFRGQHLWSATIAPRYSLNSNLQRGADRFGLDLQLRWQGW